MAQAERCLSERGSLSRLGKPSVGSEDGATLLGVDFSGRQSQALSSAKGEERGARAFEESGEAGEVFEATRRACRGRAVGVSARG